MTRRCAPIVKDKTGHTHSQYLREKGAIKDVCVLKTRNILKLKLKGPVTHPVSAHVRGVSDLDFFLTKKRVRFEKLEKNPGKNRVAEKILNPDEKSAPSRASGAQVRNVVEHEV